MSASQIENRRRAFRRLHESGCFVIPNPWDAGSARLLQGLGFKALATTSSGYAWSLGQSDGTMPRNQVLAHLRELASATDLPLNADFESGYGDTLQAIKESVKLAVDTGIAGLSIEDSTGNPSSPVHDLDVAVARLKAARAAIDETGTDTLLVGRAENFWFGRRDLEDTARRLKAYADAGADCLYAPGIQTRSEIRTIVEAVAPKPVNLLVGTATELTLSDIAALGVRRVSLGGALARAAWGGMLHAARQIAEDGRFDAFADATSGAALNAFFNAKGSLPPPK